MANESRCLHKVLHQNSALKNDYPVTNGIQFARSALLELGKDILPLYDQNASQGIINRLSESCKKLTRAEILHKKFDRIVADELVGDTSVCEINDDQICSDKSYVEFVAALKKDVQGSFEASTSEPQHDVMEICADSSGDESVVDIDSEPTSVIATIDPLTMRNIKNPVRNQICGHIYDGETILNFMKASDKIVRCPYAGCENLNLSKEHLHTEPINNWLQRSQKSKKEKQMDGVIEAW
ncbi:unnamed protein product [Allacma fusca]|uniref:E3 SUMO-protein ligase NSE2 n=1 Tax=Allacma fusca TaxID=39272 RepID=A0A8J2KAI4_9HEXA|nr:unnamed protein product [Allacma fusca]